MRRKNIALFLQEDCVFKTDKLITKSKILRVFVKWEQEMQTGIGKGSQKLLMLEIMDCFENG